MRMRNVYHLHIKKEHSPSLYAESKPTSYDEYCVRRLLQLLFRQCMYFYCASYKPGQTFSFITIRMELINDPQCCKQFSVLCHTLIKVHMQIS